MFIPVLIIALAAMSRAPAAAAVETGYEKRRGAS